MERRMWFLMVLSLIFPTISSPALAQWQPDGVALCSAADIQSNTYIVSDGAGGAIVAWEDQRVGASGIYAQRVDALGVPQWTLDGVALCIAPNFQSFLSIVSDGAGGVIATWQDKRSGAYDIYAQRVDASGVPQWTANGVTLCSSAADQITPKIVSDGAGGAIVTWQDKRSGGTYPGDIYAQRVDALGVPQWTANGVAVCTAADEQSYPKIISDGVGGAIVTWHDFRSGTDYDIYAQRVDSSGAPQWTAQGVVLCIAVTSQERPDIASDGFGGAIVTWEDARNGTVDIYAQRIGASGVPQWTAQGVTLCTAGSVQELPTIISDGAGGAIATWTDYRGVTADIYAQWVDASGINQWTGDGVLCTTALYDQYNPEIVSDGGGGVLITWVDERNGTDTDIYSCTVNSSGQVTAGAGGVCTAAYDQLTPHIVSDGAGGAIIAWADKRSAFADIYAQRVFPIPTGAPAPTPSMPLALTIDPNPAGEGTTLNFHLDHTIPTSVAIYDVNGRLVDRLINQQPLTGDVRIPWHNSNVPNGVYFARVSAGAATSTQKITLVR